MDWNDGGVAQVAWRELTDYLRDADASFLDPSRGVFGEIDVAEGYRHLAHLLSYAFDFFVDSDPERPMFVPIATKWKKLLGDNTDTVYYYTNVDGRGVYRIRGQRGDTCYLSFIAHAGPDRAHHLTQRTVSNLNHQEIAFDADGSFEVTLSKERPAGVRNWMKLEDDAACIITREYYFDRATDRPASYAIERIDSYGPPPPLTRDEIARRFRAVIDFMRVTFTIVPMRVDNWNECAEPFRFTFSHPSWGTPDNIYARCFYKLEPDEALVIEGLTVPCAYWGIQLWNIFMQSHDYRHHRSSVNLRQAGLEPGDPFRVVIAHTDPGIPNWLDTAGHTIGAAFVRWLCADGLPPRPTATVVNVADLKS